MTSKTARKWARFPDVQFLSSSSSEWALWSQYECAGQQNRQTLVMSGRQTLNTEMTKVCIFICTQHRLNIHPSHSHVHLHLLQLCSKSQLIMQDETFLHTLPTTEAGHCKSKLLWRRAALFRENVEMQFFYENYEIGKNKTK